MKELMDRRVALGLPSNLDVTPEEARANSIAGRLAIPSDQEPVVKFQSELSRVRGAIFQFESIGQQLTDLTP
jgi:hypothetical protein